MHRKVSSTPHSLPLRECSFAERYHRCISCGLRICRDDPWTARYRVLYSTPSGTQLSDVHETESNWPHYQSVNKDYAEELGPWYVMGCIKPSKAVFIHESCWFLVIQHFEREDVNLDRLFEVCRDIPPSGRETYRSWEYSRFYPWKRPIIRGLRDAAEQFPKIYDTANRSGSKRIARFTSDCFSFLAMEIRVIIANYLSTVDYLSLRQSSRAMVDVFGIQSFWKSRFLVNGDRGFLNYLIADPRSYESKNWRGIYRCTVNIDRSNPHLWEMRRQWRNNRWLREIYSMVKASDKEIATSSKLLSELRWKESYTGLRCDRVIEQGKDWSICKTCWMKHTPFTQVVLLESSVIGLVVSILREGTQTYITGFDLVTAHKERPNMTFGYRLPGESVTINLLGKKLRGFTLIKGEAGIHAIRPTFMRNKTTSWIGRPEGEGICKTTQLWLHRGIKAFSGKFDYCKMIGLSIA